MSIERIIEDINRASEEELKQQTKEAFASFDARQAKRQEEMNSMMTKLDNLFAAEKKAKREQERKEAIDKAAREIDDKYRHEDLDPSLLSLLNSLK